MDKRHQPKVYMMDLLATVPYYTAYLSRALLDIGVTVRVGSITYYLDSNCFKGQGIELSPGFMDVVGHFQQLPRLLRRVGKLIELSANLFFLSCRFLLLPPDILHVQYLPLVRSFLPMDLWFVRLMKKRGVQTVLTVHDILPHDTGDVHHTLFRDLYARMDSLICHSEHVRHRLVEEFLIAKERVNIIPHGPLFYDLPHQALGTSRVISCQPFVLWQGIVFPYKGLDLLMEAWKHVEASTTNASLLVVGTGAPDILEAVRDQVRRSHLKRVILDFRFVSAEELVAIYRAAGLVVYPYRAITTSGALATGLSLGKAIIASDLPVFRELLTNGKDALLVDPEDSFALSQAILRILQEPGLRERLSAATLEKNFGARSWTAIAEQTTSLYCSL